MGRSVAGLAALALSGAALLAGPAQAAPAAPGLPCLPSWLGSTGAVDPTTSADGRFVAFDAMSPEFDDGGVSAVFLRDVRRGVTVPVALPRPGGRPYGSVISDDGSRVAYLVATTDAVDRSHAVFVYDRRRGTTTAEGRADNGSELDLSADGRHLAYRSAGTNEWDWSITPDVYVRDLDRDTVRLVSVSTTGGRGNGASIEPTISADGRYVLFSSQATDLTGDDPGGGPVYLRDLVRRRTTVVPGPDGDTATVTGGGQRLSPDGRYVVYQDPSRRIQLHDLARNRTRALGPVADEESRSVGPVDVSAHGRYVAYGTSYLDAASGDAFTQLYVHRVRTGTEVHASAGLDGDQPWRGSYLGALTPDGGHLAFASEATNLVPDDTNGVMDVFVRDLRAGRTTLVSAPPTADRTCPA